MNTDQQTASSTPVFDLGLPAPDRRPVTIGTRRNMLLSGEDGQLRHTPLGSTIKVEMHKMGMLGSDDYTITSTVAQTITDHRED